MRTRRARQFSFHFLLFIFHYKEFSKDGGLVEIWPKDRILLKPNPNIKTIKSKTCIAASNHDQVGEGGKK
jgi:hypothetical protein